MVFHTRQDVALRRENVLRIILCAVILIFPIVSALAGGAREQPEERGVVTWDRPEAPELAALVDAGELPPLEDRIPVNPFVSEPYREIGRYGGQIRSALIGPGDNAWIQRTVLYEGIVLRATDFTTVIPSLASDYEVNNDWSEFTFTLREGLRWSDGAPLTTENIAWTFENVILNEQLTPVIPPSFRHPTTGRTAELEIIDDLSFRLTFGATYPGFFQAFAMWVPAPSHYAREFHEDFNSEVHELARQAGFDNWADYYDQHVTGVRAFTSNANLPVVTPWRIVQGEEYTGENTRVRFERNPYYHRVDPEGNQLPYIDGWVFDMLEDSEVLLLRTAAGEIDLMMRHINTTDNRPVLFDNMDRGRFQFFDAISSGSVSMAIRINQTYEDEAWAAVARNRDFRAGLSHAINREEVSDIVYAGLARPRQDAPADVVPFFNERLAFQHTEYDPELAMEYFAAAGLEQDAQGHWLNYEGERIVINVDISSSLAPMIAEMELVKNHWEDVGLTVDLNVIDRTLMDQLRTTNRSQVYVWGGSSAFEPLPVPETEFQPSPAWSAWYADIPGIRPQEPPQLIREMLELWDEIQGLLPGEERVELLTQLHEMHVEAFMFIGVTTGAPPYGVVSNRLATNFRSEIVDNWPLRTPAGAVDLSTLFIQE